VPDADGDSFGDPSGEAVEVRYGKGCPAGYCWTCYDDCDDTDPARTASPETSCADGIDNDCDEVSDTADPDCVVLVGDDDSAE
jgi:hypothetical protein